MYVNSGWTSKKIYTERAAYTNLIENIRINREDETKSTRRRDETMMFGT